MSQVLCVACVSFDGCFFSSNPTTRPIPLLSYSSSFKAVSGLVAAHAARLVPELLEACGHWTVPERAKGFDALALVARVCRGDEQPLDAFLPRIVSR